jgi:cellobiose phosphorylase
VEPVLPAGWEGFTVTRQYRGTMYEIKVRREGPGNDRLIRVDGQTLEGTLLSQSDKKTVAVEVEIG